MILSLAFSRIPRFLETRSREPDIEYERVLTFATDFDFVFFTETSSSFPMLC